MAGLVGGVLCSRVVGEPHTQAMRSTIWEIPGIDGYGIHLHGLGHGETQFAVAVYGNDAVVVGVTHIPTWIAALRALQGTVVTIVNDQGVSITNQFIREVGRVESKTANDLLGTSRRVQVTINTLTV